MELFLKGIRGEKIGELADLDKKIHMLHKKLQYDAQVRSERLLDRKGASQDSYENIQEFWALLNSSLSRFDSLFEEGVGHGWVFKEEPNWEDDYEVGRYWRFRKLKMVEPYHELLLRTWVRFHSDLFEMRYDLIADSQTVEAGILFELEYGKRLNQADIEGYVMQITDKLFTHISQRLDNRTV